MVKNKFNEIRKSLKEVVYNNPTSGNVTQDVAKVFNIPFGEDGCNLTITNFNYSVPDVTIYDVIKDIKYYATLSDELPFFNHKSNKKEFLRVQTDYVGKDVSLDRYYDVDNKLLYEEVRGSLDEERFVLHRVHDSSYSDISYSEKIDLWYNDNSFAESIVKTNEESVYCLDSFVFGDGNDEESRYIVEDLSNGGLTYGIHNISLVNENLSIKGVCIENASSMTNKRLPLGMRREEFGGFNDPQVISLLVFEGFDNNMHKALEIRKYPFYISMRYAKKDEAGIDATAGELSFPNQSNGTIDEEELDMVVSRLDSDFKEDRFVSLAKSEILKFKDEIGLPWINEDGPFAIRNLASKTTDEIVSVVLNQKYDCFNGMRQRLYDACHIQEAISRKSGGDGVKEIVKQRKVN